MEARARWAALSWERRVAVFLRAAELLAGKYRQVLNAATMLNVSKTVHQAEIDSACELVDFWRFNCHFVWQIMSRQPLSTLGDWNRVDYRPLDGFVAAITPFNFTSIAGNLPTAPAMMGNTVVWKPSSDAVLPAYYIMKILEEAGLPPGVINMVPGPSSVVGPAMLNSPYLAGLHFTGSSEVFRGMWATVGQNVGEARYGCFPRIVGETGGKDFIFAHSSAHIRALIVAMVRGAFEYQGQKCSAASRAYVPRSIWPQVRQGLIEDVARLRVGNPCDPTIFMGAVINQSAFDRFERVMSEARTAGSYEIVCGGGADNSVGYFVEPTVIVSEFPDTRLMVEELFLPVLTVYVYDDVNFEDVLELCADSSPYRLTGAVFAQDPYATETMLRALRFVAGNMVVNAKPTAAAVGRQPFGGSGASGTNDKAGSDANLLRWVSMGTVKEQLVPELEVGYPSMEPDRT